MGAAPSQRACQAQCLGMRPPGTTVAAGTPARSFPVPSRWALQPGTGLLLQTPPSPLPQLHPSGTASPRRGSTIPGSRAPWAWGHTSVCGVALGVRGMGPVLHPGWEQQLTWKQGKKPRLCRGAGREQAGPASAGEHRHSVGPTRPQTGEKGKKEKGRSREGRAGAAA